MTLRYRHEVIDRLGVELFTTVGVSLTAARVTVESLVTSSLMGHDSHGVMRIPEYLGFVEDGSIDPQAVMSSEQTSPTTSVVDCGRGLGPAGARFAIDEGIRLARTARTACVITRRANHVGRLGAWVQRAAEQGLIALATCNSPVYGHFVLPWGGREGRLATNPIAYAIPSGGDPLVADFSTSVAPEGKVRFYRNQGQPTPEGWILDADGQPTTDPAAFYGPPRGGILPLGGAAGHKGYALGLLVELLGAALAGIGPCDPDVFGNGVCFLLIDPIAFCPLEQFRKRVDETVAYLKSSPPAPGFDEVLVPGEPEFRTARKRRQEGIPMDPQTLQELLAAADRLGVCSSDLQPRSH